MAPLFQRGAKLGTGADQDRWVVLRKLGEGQFAEVYEVRDTQCRDKDVRHAVKIEKKKDMRSVRGEFKVLRRLVSASSVCPVLDSGVWEDRFFIIMELLGPNLAEARRAAPGGVFSVPLVRHIAAATLAALEQVHAAGFVHRDVKPANFACCPPTARPWEGTWKIIDFGLARKYTDDNGDVIEARKDAAFRGSSMYASLYAHQDLDLGRRDDLWSWLYVIVELLEGTLPWRVDKDLADAGGGTVAGVLPASAPAAAATASGTTPSSAREPVATQKARCMAEAKLLFKSGSVCGVLVQISEYLRTLEFADIPDYDHLRGLLAQLPDKDGAALEAEAAAWQMQQQEHVLLMQQQQLQQQQQHHAYASQQQHQQYGGWGGQDGGTCDPQQYGMGGGEDGGAAGTSGYSQMGNSYGHHHAGYGAMGGQYDMSQQMVDSDAAAAAAYQQQQYYQQQWHQHTNGQWTYPQQQQQQYLNGHAHPHQPQQQHYPHQQQQQQASLQPSMRHGMMAGHGMVKVADTPASPEEEANALPPTRQHPSQFSGDAAPSNRSLPYSSEPEPQPSVSPGTKGGWGAAAAVAATAAATAAAGNAPPPSSPLPPLPPPDNDNEGWPPPLPCEVPPTSNAAHNHVSSNNHHNGVVGIAGKPPLPHERPSPNNNKHTLNIGKPPLAPTEARLKRSHSGDSPGEQSCQFANGHGDKKRPLSRPSSRQRLDAVLPEGSARRESSQEATDRRRSGGTGAGDALEPACLDPSSVAAATQDVAIAGAAFEQGRLHPDASKALVQLSLLAPVDALGAVAALFDRLASHSWSGNAIPIACALEGLSAYAHQAAVRAFGKHDPLATAAAAATKAAEAAAAAAVATEGTVAAAGMPSAEKGQQSPAPAPQPLVKA